MKFLCLCYVLSQMFVVSGWAGTEVIDVSPEKAVEMMNSREDPRVIDVRSAEEYADGHIKGATLLDVNAGDFEELLSKLDRSKVYLIHCRSGARSARALKLFKKLDFEKVYHLQGGIQAWQKAKKPVVKGE
ncbi:rhodanese-like domain-containing protein [Rubritalea spongiae]|uniref:Rhodanese-like domain-containing protein n=1 Tax=Rubritalea spongiae TaxID=430797 RepID=A0ABW5E2T3_9BACT